MTTTRTIVIGDLHGCVQEAVELLEKCKRTVDDRVIFLGDLVDRGADSGNCVDLAMQIEKEQGSPSCILGNHEDRHVIYRRKEKLGQDPNVQVATHVATRKQLTDEHYEYFEKLPLYIRLPEHNAVCVHAGVFPGFPVEEQDPYHLLHIQSIKPPETRSCWPSRVPDDTWRFWTTYYTGNESVIFGHSVFDKPLITEKLYGIDGGAVFGMQLHALILPEFKLVSVDGKANYGVGHRGREQDRKIKTYPVQDGINTFS